MDSNTRVDFFICTHDCGYHHSLSDDVHYNDDMHNAYIHVCNVQYVHNK